MSSAEDERDVIPTTSDSNNVIVEVSGTAGPNLSTSMEFTVKLVSKSSAEKEKYE